MVADDLASGALVKALDIGLPGFGFYPVYEPDHPRRAVIETFVAWLTAIARDGRSDDAFAKAHDWGPGSRFSAILNGRKQGLVIVGTAFSPEFIYEVGPGAFMPDDRRFGVVWMSENALADVYNLDGAFSSVTVKLLRWASEPEAIKRMDALLDPYGGQAAYGRRDQPSHAWGDHGLDMLRNMSRTLPPIFLLIGAFLVNQWLNRLVALEREQIGLLKALGYGNPAIAWHYAKFVIALVAAGVVIGSAVGTWVGAYVTGMFGSLLHFPFLIFITSADVYVLAGALSLIAGIGGAARALRSPCSRPPLRGSAASCRRNSRSTGSYRNRP